jgi:TPR repeat protein
MIQSLSQHELEQNFANAVNTIHSQMNFTNAIQELEVTARAGHGKAALFLAELYFQGFRVERDLHKAQYWQHLATMQA